MGHVKERKGQIKDGFIGKNVLFVIIPEIGMIKGLFRKRR